MLRFRLRSASNSTTSSNSEVESKTSSSSSSSSMDNEPVLGECYVCGQQNNDNEELGQLITCSLCSRQYHLKCLGLKSEKFANINSKLYKQWICRKCRRCLLCRKKRSKFINENNQNLRSHPERKLNTLEMISCRECDSSIHLICFFRQQQNDNLTTKQQQLSIRELRKRRKNFLCQRCIDNNNKDFINDDDDDKKFVEQEQSIKKLKNKLSNEIKDEINDEQQQQQIIKCPLSDNGCNSLGHLSGCYDYHSMIETCPLYHNQTIDECKQRYRKRLEQLKSKLKYRLSPRKSTKLELIQHKNPKWNKIMNERNLESKQLLLMKKTTTTTQLSKNNQQPKLDEITSKLDLNLFYESQSLKAQMLHENSAIELFDNNKDDNENNQKQKQQQKIIFGNYEINTWYSSQYSDEYQNCLKLFICKYCLKCWNSSILYQRHLLSKCFLKHPPGQEIYRNKQRISFFEIDGHKQKEYCQNLCLLSKLFLEYKTLFIDVEPFLFYIMTKYDDKTNEMNILGYFSKEKQSVSSINNCYNNVSCILTLPQYQRMGYGRMLIEFSYLLTRQENKFGSPEKPLSDYGIISYRSYWKFILMDYLSTFDGKDILLKDISQQTGINTTDLISTLQLMGILKYWKGKHLILMNDEQRKRFLLEIKLKRKLLGDRYIDSKFLHWKPSNK